MYLQCGKDPLLITLLRNVERNRIHLENSISMPSMVFKLHVHSIQTDGYSVLHTSSLKYHLLMIGKGTIPKIFHFKTVSFIFFKQK